MKRKFLGFLGGENNFLKRREVVMEIIHSPNMPVVIRVLGELRIFDGSQY